MTFGPLEYRHYYKQKKNYMKKKLHLYSGKVHKKI